MSRLQDYIARRKQDRDILLMAHAVCGFPSFDDNLRALEVMAEAGVDLVELQFPFSEPSADGPMFVRANELSLRSGTTVDQCFGFMQRVTERFDFPVMMMGYYNTVFRMGEPVFVERLNAAGGCAFILPDLPLEEAAGLHELAVQREIDPVILVTPTTGDKRLAKLTGAARGMIYAVARRGVTGSKTEMGEEVIDLVRRCRQCTDVPVGVGFGIAERGDLDFLRGHADVAIIGTAALRAWEEGGADALREFFRRLRD